MRRTSPHPGASPGAFKKCLGRNGARELPVTAGEGRKGHKFHQGSQHCGRGDKKPTSVKEIDESSRWQRGRHLGTKAVTLSHSPRNPMITKKTLFKKKATERSREDAHAFNIKPGTKRSSDRGPDSGQLNEKSAVMYRRGACATQRRKNAVGGVP